VTGRRASHPRFRRVGDAPRVALTVDDEVILQHVYRHRFIRSDDLYQLLPDRSPDRLSRRLTLLYRARFLDRPIAQIDRFHKGGSQTFVYGLDKEGARYLKERLGTSIGATDWRSRNRRYTRENLDHTLAVTRFMVDLEVACRAVPDVSLIAFDEILANAPELTRRSPSPMCWEVPVQWHGGRATVRLAPDAIFGLRVAGQDGKARRAFFFLEVDRGTMTIVPSERVRESDAFPYRATVLRKLYAYTDSFRAKRHEAQLGIRMPRTLIVTDNGARASLIRQATGTIDLWPHGRLPDIFIVLATDQCTSADRLFPLLTSGVL
jgi:hypothetical protein